MIEALITVYVWGVLIFSALSLLSILFDRGLQDGFMRWRRWQVVLLYVGVVMLWPGVLLVRVGYWLFQRVGE